MGVIIAASSCIIALGWVAVWYAGAWVTTKLSPSWPRSTVANENSHHWGACTIMSTINAVISASVCVPCVLYYLWKSPVEWFHVVLSDDFCYDTTGVFAQAAVALAGQSFTIRTAVDMLLQFIHGLLTVEEAIHHVIYVLAGFLIRRYCMMPMNAAILMSMEISTPFLNYYLFFRARYPFSKDVNVAKTIFGVLFVAFRILFNSFGVFIFLRQHWWTEGGIPAMHAKMPEWEQIIMLVIIIANGTLQLFWGKKIVMGLLKSANGNREPAAQALRTDKSK